MRTRVLLFLIVMTAAAQASALSVISTATEATIGALTFQEDDLVSTTPAVVFDGGPGPSGFSLTENIDAVHFLDNGNILLSTQNDATLGGLTFDESDLVEYNPGTNTATLFFDGSILFGGAANIDAVSILSSGNLVLSTVLTETLGGLTFEDGDLVEYNPGTDTGTLFFDEDLFSLTEDIDAVHVLSNGNIVLSTDNNATLGTLTFNEGQLVEYNPGTDIAALFVDNPTFTGPENIDAVFVPEPSTAVLLGLGLALVGRRRA